MFCKVNMRVSLLVALFLPLFFCYGCATAKLPSGPYLNPSTSFSHEKSVGLIPAIDERPSLRLGHVSVVNISVAKEDAEKLLTSHLAFSMDRDLSVNVVPLRSTKIQDASSEAVRYKLDKIVISRIKSLEISSFDASIDPAVMRAVVAMEFYDALGALVFESDYEENQTMQINTSDPEKSVGKMIALLMKDIADRVATDERIRRMFHGDEKNA